MTHLTDIELLTLVEERGPAMDAARAHLEACAACRGKLTDLRDGLDLAASVAIPEPSPLFWDHFSARVRNRLQDVSPDRATGWRVWRGGTPFRLAAAAATVLLIAIAGVMWRTGAPGSTNQRPDMVLGTAGGGVRDSNLPAVADFDDDGAWALVRDAADDVSWDDAVAAGWIVPTGSADEAALLTLTAEERGELLQLLRAETKRSGA